MVDLLAYASLSLAGFVAVTLFPASSEVVLVGLLLAEDPLTVAAGLMQERLGVFLALVTIAKLSRYVILTPSAVCLCFSAVSFPKKATKSFGKIGSLRLWTWIARRLIKFWPVLFRMKKA